MKILVPKTGLTCIVKDIPSPGKAAGFKYLVFVNTMASILIMCCAGSVYAWSIFVDPLRITLGLTTAQTQLIFGFIIASFSITMLFVGRIERRLGPRLNAPLGGGLF